MESNVIDIIFTFSLYLSPKWAPCFHCFARCVYVHRIQSNKRILSILPVMMEMISIHFLYKQLQKFPIRHVEHKTTFNDFISQIRTSIRQNIGALFGLHCLHFYVYSLFTLSKSQKQNERNVYVARDRIVNH